MGDNNVEEVLTDAIEAAEGNANDPKNLSLESLILLINSSRLKYLQENTFKELGELKGRQTKVAELHKIMKAINNATDASGNLDLTKNEEVKKLIESAKELGVDVQKDKTSYNREERDRLVENIRMTIEDLNIENDMQLQGVSRLTNERYESYQMARSILKPLHEAKTSLAKNIK